ncbi:MAG: glycosyltransferase family 2 protein [Chloroflexi bacterium]|nr:glycosyltransferase family 2 protein [Chloroflexota bacterium]
MEEGDWLTIIVPTRNEAGNVRPLLQRLAQVMGERPFTVLFVDDSSDGTPQVVQEAAADFLFPIQLITRPPEQRNGLSGAVVEGFRAASGRWLCVMDADLQHPPEVIPALLARAEEADADVVVGSRKASLTGPLGLSRKRAMTSQVLTLLARASFPRLLKNVSDPLTGLFLVRRAAVNIDALRPDGFKILLEILIRCPGLRVSELHFDFGARHDGDSKADFREGMRFFRHLLRLRATANQSFPRLIAVALGSMLLDTALFAFLTQFTKWPFWITAVLSAELFILLRFTITEKWVLGGGHPVAGWPSFRRFFISNQISLLFARLPLLALFLGRWQWPLLSAGFSAILIEGVVRYLASEQWVFSVRGMTMWQPAVYRYNIHGLLGIESEAPLPELTYFETAMPLPHVDIAVRVDRHGTPSPQPGAITYDERLSRFGFGVAIMPGEFTEVVVSPALEKAPYALYKSVLEPVLRWAFIRKGCALVYGGCVAQDGQATLIVPNEDKGKTEATLTAVTQANYEFMADDFTVLAADGRVYSFPKPLTVTPAVMRMANGLGWRQSVTLRIQTLFYSSAGRKTGLQMSDRRWPTATFNIYLQRLITPPKWRLTSLLPTVRIADSARLTAVLQLDAGQDQTKLLSMTEATQFVQTRTRAAHGFPPYALLNERLRYWQNKDWSAAESAIIVQALQFTVQLAVSSNQHPLNDRWLMTDDRRLNIEY